MQPHRIRLAGPWTYEWLQRDDGPAHAAAGELRLPIEWVEAFGPVAGEVRFRRPFGRPTNLDDNERVTLCFDGVGGTGRVLLNDQTLGTLESDRTAARFDVTQLLQLRNVLLVDLGYSPDAFSNVPGGLWGSVSLEIEAISSG